jgi:hypothetical protein
MGSANRRRLLFGLAVAALLFASVALSALPERGREQTRPAAPGHNVMGPPNHPGSARPRRRLRHRASRFLSAFLSYEVGHSGPAVRADLRATATPAFAADLLRGPPRPPAVPLAPARLQDLSAVLTTLQPPRALISGSARRGGEVEQFSFLFGRTSSGWLASGPGE